jgi:hypothetical protein
MMHMWMLATSPVHAINSGIGYLPERLLARRYNSESAALIE